MAENTKIEWARHTGNIWEGCTKVHAGCDHCYAETLSHRWGKDLWGPDKPRRLGVGVWNDFAKWQKQAAAAGEVWRIFVGSMMDIWEKPMPLVSNDGSPAIDYADGSPICTDYARDRFLTEVVPACPNLFFLLLSKRPGNAEKYVPESWQWGFEPPANVIYGYSPVDEKTVAEARKMFRLPGRYFLSMEPLLGPVDLTRIHWEKRGSNYADILNGTIEENNPITGDRQTNPYHKVNWVIVGGESGPGARPMNPDWVRAIRDQCAAAGIPFLFKQWGEWAPCEPCDAKVIDRKNLVIYSNGEWISGTERDPAYAAWFGNLVMKKIGKHAAGRTLDGVIHDGFPSDKP